MASGFNGVGWARSGVYALSNDKYLAVHGIQNVIDILEEIVGSSAELILLKHCPAPKVLGRPLTVVNPFVARTTLGNGSGPRWKDFSGKQG